VNEPIEDGIGKRGVGNDLMPMLDRQLAGDQSGTESISILQDFQKIVSLFFDKFGKPPVVEDQKVGTSDGSEQVAGQSSLCPLPTYHEPRH
jgi:hypothetical protein